jgi:Subtilisin inhibitor-like
MRSALTLTIASLVLVACSAAAAGSADGTSLRIAYWETGMALKPDRVWTLRCAPAGGTLAQPARACRRLDAGGTALFAPTSPKLACTQIYGGPQRARVTGLVDGKRVWAMFSRSDGCEIHRWAKLSPWLLPPGGES